MALILVENFDNAEALRHIEGTLTLLDGEGKGESNACQLLTSNKIQVKPSQKIVLGFYIKEYISEYVSFGNPTGGESFRVNFSRIADGSVTMSFYNPRQEDIADYPVISNQTGYQDTDVGYSLIEIELDLTNATAFEGILKIAIDGITYVDLSNVCNAPVDQWATGLTSESARFSSIAFSDWLVDSIYVCNEDKLFNDSFFGPYDITTLYPLMDGDQTNWERSEYLESVPDSDTRGNAEFVTKNPFDEGTADALNVVASQTLTRDLFFFDSYGLPNIDVDVKGLEQRIWQKGISEHHDEELVVITPIAKASGRDIESVTEYESMSKAFYFKQMRTPFDVLPTVSTAWTQEGLDLTQFGYCFYETKEVNVTADSTITTENLTSGSVSDLTDEDDATYIKATLIVFTFATAIKVKSLEFLTNTSAAIDSASLWDADGKEYTPNAKTNDELVVTITNHEDHLLKDITQIKVITSGSYNVHSANIIAWEKVE